MTFEEIDQKIRQFERSAVNPVDPDELLRGLGVVLGESYNEDISYNKRSKLLDRAAEILISLSQSEERKHEIRVRQVLKGLE